MRKKLENLLESEIDPAFLKRARFIFDWVEKKKPGSVLDAGCGRGFYSNALSVFPFIERVEGFDTNLRYLSEAKKNVTDRRVNLRQADIYKLPFKKNSFDLIILSEVLEHLPNDRLALTLLRQLLKPKGILLLTVPNENFPFLWDPLNWILMRVFHTHIPSHIWWLAGIWADHQRLYQKPKLLELVKRAGFRTVEVKEAIRWSWPFSHFVLYGVGKNIVERFHLAEFSRFDPKPRPLAKIVARVFRFPSSFLDKKLPLDASMNLLLSLTK